MSIPKCLPSEDIRAGAPSCKAIVIQYNAIATVHLSSNPLLGEILLRCALAFTVSFLFHLADGASAQAKQDTEPHVLPGATQSIGGARGESIFHSTPQALREGCH
jgi:hypothetical protein